MIKANKRGVFIKILRKSFDKTQIWVMEQSGNTNLPVYETTFGKRISDDSYISILEVFKKETLKMCKKNDVYKRFIIHQVVLDIVKHCRYDVDDTLKMIDEDVIEDLGFVLDEYACDVKRIIFDFLNVLFPN